jgi:hypothetical protein
MAQRIFRRTAPPAGHADLPVNRQASWYTWSEPFLMFLTDAAEELTRLANPPFVRVQGLQDYNRTYSSSPSELRDRRLARRLLGFARSLHTTRPSARLMLLDDVRNDVLGAGRLKSLFALLRGALVELTGDEHEAMYTPLGDVGKRVRSFPLHADLYLPRILFNVFDNVPEGDSGASTFLPVTTLAGIIPEVRLLPRVTGKRILAMFDREPASDRFDALYDLLHGDHPWVKPLELAMTSRQFRVKLHAGQGYLLNDRAWLHGREAPAGGVAEDRVHRLVFARS